MRAITDRSRLPAFDWEANGYPQRGRAIIADHETARARIRDDGDLRCITLALHADQAFTRAAASLGYIDANGRYHAWADAGDVLAALEQSRARDA